MEFCKQHHILLISDAAYTDMYFKPELKPMSILEIEGAKDIAVEFFSFSKPYAITGWRLGWVCGNAEAVKIFGKLKSTLDSGLFKALQKACAEILNSEEGEKYIEEANKRFKNESNPKVVVTVDLLTTGIDVPEIVNHVFMRRIKSRILFEQNAWSCDKTLSCNR